MTGPGGYRICVFTGNYYPHLGGLEQYTASLWERLAKRGCKVLVVTGNTDKVAEKETVNGIEVVRLPVVSTFDGRFPIVIPGPGFFKLLREVKDWSPTLVVTNTRFFPISVVGRFFAYAVKKPHFHIEHGSGHIVLDNWLLNKLGEAWDHVFGGYVLRNATKCFGVSKSISKFVGHLGRKQCGVIYNGVDISLFSPGQSSLREQLGVRKDSFLFLFAGRLTDDKGIKVLLEAFDLLGQDMDCELAIAGGGYLENFVEEAAAKNPRVHFVGRLGRDAMIDFLRAGDCFVLPTSAQEGLPTSILEAQAVGLPVITTPKGGNREAVRDKVNGLIVPTGDVGSLKDALLTLAKDPSGARAMGARARRSVAETFDWELIADGVMAEIETLRLKDRE